MAQRKRVGTRKFGWCLDGLHDRCWVISVGGGRCQCDCHDTPTEPQPTPNDPISC